MVRDDKKNGKEKFIKLLKQVFDVSTEDGYNFNFKEKGTTQQEVAKKIGKDKSTLSRMLQPSFNGTFHEVNKELQKLLDIKQQEQRKALVKKLLIPLLIFGFGIFISQLFFKPEQLPPVDKAPDHSEINSLVQFKFFYKTLGEVSARKMADAAAGEMYSIQKRIQENGNLTDDDKIQYVKNMFVGIRGILVDDRDELKAKNFLVKGKRNIVDFVEYHYPLDKVFFCSPKEVALSDTMTNCIKASPFDMNVFLLTKQIFRANADENKIRQNVLSLVKKVQLEQAKKTDELFRCYMEKGETCFSKK